MVVQCGRRWLFEPMWNTETQHLSTWKRNPKAYDMVKTPSRQGEMLNHAVWLKQEKERRMLMTWGVDLDGHDEKRASYTIRSWMRCLWYAEPADRVHEEPMDGCLVWFRPRVSCFEVFGDARIFAVEEE